MKQDEIVELCQVQGDVQVDRCHGNQIVGEVRPDVVASRINIGNNSSFVINHHGHDEDISNCQLSAWFLSCVTGSFTLSRDGFNHHQPYLRLLT